MAKRISKDFTRTMNGDGRINTTNVPHKDLARLTPGKRGFYRLYLWGPHGPAQTLPRGKCIGTFERYKDLVADAQKRTVAAGYPKSRWWQLFDWNLGA